MKMLLGCCYTLLLVFIAVVSGVVMKEIRKVGDGALFKPDITTSLKDVSITWKYSAGGEVIKVIEWDHDFKTLETLNPKFKTRVDLDKTTGELTIRDLQLEHTGLYTIEISNKEQEKKINLIVMEGVPKPTLIPEKTDNDNARYLRCKYNTMIKIRWNCTYGETPQKTDLDKPGQEESITFKRSGNQDVCCTCILFNEVSEESSNPICRKNLFEDSVNGVVIFLWILLAIFILIIFLILFIILLFLCVKSVHDCIYDSYKDKQPLRVIVVYLHGQSKFKAQTTGQHRANSNPNGAKEEGVGLKSNASNQEG